MYTHNFYIFKKLVGPMVLICFSLTAVAWLTQSLRFIDLVVNRGLGGSMFLYLSSLMIPALLWVTLPIALFITITVVFQKMQQDSEITVMRAAGFSRYDIIRPAVFFTLLVTLAAYSIGLYLLPKSYREFKDLQMVIRNSYTATLLQEGVFSSPSEHLTVYIRERDENNKLRGILVHDTSNPNQHITYMANQGIISSTDEGPVAILEHGNRQTVNPEDGSLSFLHFERYTLTLATLNLADMTARIREPKERYLHELFSPQDTQEAHLLNKFKAEGHFRIVWPLVNIAIMCLALLPHMTGSHRRRSSFKRILFCSFISLIMILVILGIGRSIASQPELVAWLYIILACILAVSLYLVSFNHNEILQRYYDHKMKQLRLEQGELQ